MKPGLQTQGRVNTGFLLEIPAGELPDSIKDLFVLQPAFPLIHETGDYYFAAWGDPIVRSSLPASLWQDSAARYITENIAGHFWYILLIRGTGELIAGNSAFGILPVYYWDQGDRLVVSDNALTLGRHVNLTKISSRFVVETILFHYPLFDNSMLEGIKLLPANSHLSVLHGKWSVRKHLAVEDMFGNSPLPWKKVVDKTADAFIESVATYLPAERYSSALTGGFDGRTLVSAGLGLSRELTAFSFGAEDAEDVRIASQVASSAGVPFRKIRLGHDYVRNDSLDCGIEFILNASGSATFARAHYLYAARSLSADFKYMVTGNFGSEIFRSPHVPGSVISPNTATLFMAGTVEKAVDQIEKSAEYRSLNRDNLRDAWGSVKTDLHLLPCFNPVHRDLTKNQQFYIFVFEEVFRKYFGAEMVNQFGSIINRTPFLDFGFLKVIFESRLAGVHSDFFEHNPVKRYKGQVLYAHIIRKAFPSFGKIRTDKGYSPDDLLSIRGKAAIAANYFRKKLRRQQAETDPYAVRASWDYNRDNWMAVSVPEEFFNLSSTGDVLHTMSRDLKYKILSLAVAIRESPGNH